MAGHGFRGADWDIFCVVAKDPFEGARFEYVADGGGSAVGVYVADVFGLELGVLDGGAHDAVGTVAVGGGLRDVVGVAGHAVADNFGEDGGVAFLRVLEGFEDEDAGAFADHETVAAGSERAGGVSGIVVASGERFHGGETADAHGSDGGFRAAADHHFGGAALDDFEGVADSVGGSGARGGSGGIRALGAIANGDVAGSQIDDGGRDEKGRDSAWTALDQFPVLAFDDVETADAGRDVDADFVEVRIFGLPVGGFYGEIRSRESDLDEAAHFFQFFFLDPLEGIEVLDFTGDLAVKAGGVELRDDTNAALAGYEVLPGFLRADAQRADQSNTRNDYPASQLCNAPC